MILPAAAILARRECPSPRQRPRMEGLAQRPSSLERPANAHMTNPSPPLRPASARSALGAGLLALAAASGCGDGPLVAGGPAAGGRLELRPLAEVPGSPEPVLYRRLTPPPGLAPWEVRSGIAAVGAGPRVEGRAPARHLRVSGGDLQLFIPGSFLPGEFNRLIAHLVRRRGSAYAEFHRGGEAALRSEWRRQPLNADAVLDLPGTASQGEPFDGILLNFRGHEESWILRSVDLVQTPLVTLLPDASRGAALVRLAQDARREGGGLSAGAPLRGIALVPERGRLTFSHGWPDDPRAPESGAELIVRLIGAAQEEVVHRLPLAGEAGGIGVWRHEALPLDRWSGERLEVRFELEVRGGEGEQLAIAEVAVHPAAQDPTTVLLVTSDTHRADHLGAARSPVAVQTPVIDRLAARGILFEDCLASCNYTNPSHVALMTATHPRDSGILDNGTSLADEAMTLAERFSQAGFATLAVTSIFHLCDPVSRLGQGFDRMSWPSDLLRDAGEAVDVLDSWLVDFEDRPLFLWLHLADAHAPYDPPEPFGRLSYPRSRDPRDPALPEPTLPVPRHMPDVRDVEWVRAQYRGEVSYLDAQLGRLLDRPRIASAIVALTADHGESLGERGSYWNHHGIYLDTLHVPLLLAFPGAPAGARVSAPVRHLDTGRTLLDLAGLQRVEFPGGSLLPAPERAARSDEPRFALRCLGRSASVTIGRWHLVLHLPTHLRPDPLPPEEAVTRPASAPLAVHSVELYDRVADPACENDRVDSEFERARRMRVVLVDWLGRASETGWAVAAPLDDVSVQQLALLGYADAEESGPLARLFDPDCDCAGCQRFR